MAAFLRRAVKHVKFDRKYVPFWDALAFPFDWFYRTQYTLIERTSQVTVVAPPAYTRLVDAAQPCIYINWHTHLPFLIHYLGRQGPCMLVSNAPYLNPVVKWCVNSGLNVLRGGSGEGGESKMMLREMLAEEKKSIILAVDGPTGPIYKVKRGCVELAQETGCPIVHVHYTCRKGRGHESRWDKMLNPSLFDEICVAYSEPLYFSPSMSVERATQLIEDSYFQRIDNSTDDDRGQ
jgi:lysophospholipid acyltransferase (LPLAT)-like uncharacterized protein